MKYKKVVERRKTIISKRVDLEIYIQERYRKFIKRIIENKTVWGLNLKNQDVWAVVPSNENEDADVMVFWSDRACAERCAKEEWINYEPTPISLDHFLKIWLIGLNQDNLVVGTNWSDDLVGLEVKPIDLLGEIDNALK